MRCNVKRETVFLIGSCLSALGATVIADAWTSRPDGVLGVAVGLTGGLAYLSGWKKRDRERDKRERVKP